MAPVPVQFITMRPSNGIWPSTAESSVLLPAPLGPTMTWIVSRRTRNRTSSSSASR